MGVSLLWTKIFLDRRVAVHTITTTPFLAALSSPCLESFDLVASARTLAFTARAYR